MPHDVKDLGLADNGRKRIEWADKFKKALPSEKLSVIIRPLGDRSRRMTIAGRGGGFPAFCGELRSEIEKWR